MAASTVTINDVKRAQGKIRGVAVRTPLLASGDLSRLTGADVYVKAENLQMTGSFKIRGATNKISSLSPEECARGVVAASAGNHAQGVALAAAARGIKATVVMPEGAALTKLVATRAYGAEVILWGASYDHAYERALSLAAERGLAFIHAFEDPLVISGQGSVGLEILEDLPETEIVVVPVGGGGLVSGIGVAIKEQAPRVRVIGAQPSGAAAMYYSHHEGQVVEVGEARTLADGLAVKKPGPTTFRLLEKYIDDIVTVEEHEIARAILMYLEKARLVVEGAGAVGLAALLYGKVAAAGRKIVLVASGGNIDVNVLARIIEKGLVEEGRYVRLTMRLLDQPGELQRMLRVIAETRGNVVSVYHDRLRPDVAIGESQVELTVESRDRDHALEIISQLRAQGYPCMVIPQIE